MVGPSFRDRTLAIKSRKNSRKSAFVKKTAEIKKRIFLLDMPKYEGP